MFRRWLSHSLNLALGLLFAVLAMQAPAITHEYVETLAQVAASVRQDIEQREASARQFYSIDAQNDEQFVAALRRFEPSNAETLALAIARERALRAAYDRISASHALLQPVVASVDALQNDQDYKAPIWKGLLGTYEPQLGLSLAAMVYAFAGLLFGTFLAQLLATIFAAFFPGRRERPGYPQ